METIIAHSNAEVQAGLACVEEAAANGLRAAVMLAYEAAPAFDPAFRVHDPGDFPLLWAAIYEDESAKGAPAAGPYTLGEWSRAVSQEEHARAVGAVREYIRQGETYQVNYTMPFTSPFEGDCSAWYADVASRAGVGYPAYLDMGRHAVLCFSPELFFRRSGSVLDVRPMKGTMARGRWTEEDETRRAELAACPKNRAENVMIVDLLRNDLGRIAEPGSVRPHRLHNIEQYPTVFQMTSSVDARLRDGVGLPEIMTALFPCGSVTGAPKVRTMEIIRELEAGPRLAYCGAMGLVGPGRAATFCVPIRTVVVDKEAGQARFCAGGGIVWDSAEDDEHEECLEKMRFLRESPPEFDLLETMLYEQRGGQGAWFLLDGHLARLEASARHFGFPYDGQAVQDALATAVSGCAEGFHKVRLLASDTGGVRVEIARLAEDSVGPPAMREATPPDAATCRTVRIAFADEPELRVSSADPFLCHKTTNRGVYSRALEAWPDCDDVVLANERGEVTEACQANVVARIKGELVTPPRESGLLNGVFRQYLLDAGSVVERPLTLADLAAADEVWLVNSVRGWQLVKEGVGGSSGDI
ncbi:aminodeoxychorismate synthase component I [Oceanidesulfovibrio indonesiensis]|uniref:Aminodeoxychorismate synthase component I n=1 Tax=Oceanidesulfovibrio indonesiensis TaxID=54767 RepID=A0A7M3MBD1_9BACT|nr:aminodeoxychorismate synthase component I [Oceanidesulfovibrio indonesiensis]TVM14874.1 aminodeoxychorismate synthase component I [Oceanidesulfovibrio indonesiensis]